MEFHELRKRLTPKLKAIARRLDGKYTTFDDEDLYQEALIHLWNEHRRRVLDDKTDSFILQSCYFFLRNYIRKTYKRIDHYSLGLNRRINDENSTLGDVLPCRSAEPLDRDRYVTAVLIKDIYRCLNAREQCVLSLCLDGFTTREIGKRLGVSHVMVVKIRNRIQNKCVKFKEELLAR